MEGGKKLFISSLELSQGEVYTVHLANCTKHLIVSEWGLYSMQHFEVFGSFAIENEITNPEFWVVTPFDPCFLLISALNKRPEVFRNLEEMLVESGLSFLRTLPNLSEQLEKVADSKEFQGNHYFRVSEAKLKDWLDKKLAVLKKGFKEKVPWAQREEVATKLGLGVLNELLESRVFEMVRDKYSLEEILSAGRPAPKPLVENYLPQPKKTETNKKPKLEKGQTKLNFGKKVT